MMCNCAKIVDFNQVEKSIKWIPSDMHDINFQSVINHFRFFLDLCENTEKNLKVQISINEPRLDNFNYCVVKSAKLICYGFQT